MHSVGVKELKNKLTYYLKLAKKGDRVLVTDRGSPIAVLHSLDEVEDTAGVEEKLASLAKKGKLRFPTKTHKLPAFPAISTAGKSASKMIIEDRR